MALRGRIAAPLLEATEALAARFAGASPFRHLVVDGFFEPAFADALLVQFPPFERGDVRNEAGRRGNKAVVRAVRGLGPAYVALDDLVRSGPFLHWLSRVTGIPELLYDRSWIGGGTHENRHGQDLDTHVDFNRHPDTRWHRRLNLIVYLNHEWRDEWGGCLELHENPRVPGGRVETVTPLFNRAVLFETTEVSWHGFRRIELPDDRRHLSRRSVALYFYTRARPAAETARTHLTVYVDRPLPERMRPGFVLGEGDVDELQVLLARRDQHLQRLYCELQDLRHRVEQLDALVDRGLVGRLRYFAGRLLHRLRR